jgi:hypothetical protein
MLHAGRHEQPIEVLVVAAEILGYRLVVADRVLGRDHMKSHTDYVSRGALPELRLQIRNYKRFKSLTTEWVALGIEYSRLKMKLPRKP